MTSAAGLRGLLCPVPTPFDESGEVDPDRLAAQIEIYATFPVDGVVVFGTSGEGPLIDETEEARSLEAARRAWPEGLLIPQVGRESVRAARRSAERAAAAGADAVLCLPPRYYPYDADAIARYWREVRDAADLPLLAYHIPQRTHVGLAADLLGALAEEGTLAGLKDSSGDLALQRALKDRSGDAFAVFNGRAMATAEALAEGADGAILAVADAAPETVAALFAAHRAGDREGASRLQASLGPLAEAFGSRFGVPGIKAALDLRGWPAGGPPRPPLAPLGSAGREAVATALRAAGVDLS
ncbi:MAG: dihydrodipicolinate synthase family protein [Gemmatimonadota bacterium]|nr:dihydrodipicolinate synthase family protein [Gemmatimonadota bacterium]